MSDAELAEGIVGGTIDHKVLREQYQRRVYHWLYPMVRNAADAEDLTDRVFVRARRRLGRYDPSKVSLGTWLYLTTRTVACSYLRRRRLPAKTLDLLGECRELPRPGSEDLPVTAEARARVCRAVEELPMPERMVMRAHYRDELTWAETAHELGVRMRTVKLHAMRGFVLLRGILRGDGVRQGIAVPDERFARQDVEFTDAELDMFGDFTEAVQARKDPDMAEFLERCPESQAKIRPILETAMMLDREVVELRRNNPHVDLGKLFESGRKPGPGPK